MLKQQINQQFQYKLATGMKENTHPVYGLAPQQNTHGPLMFTVCYMNEGSLL